MTAGYTKVQREGTEAHGGGAMWRTTGRFLKVLPVVILCILLENSLTAQQKSDSVIVFSPYERFLNIKAEYRGAVASGDTALIAEKTYLIGKRYYDLGDYYEARKWLFKALKLRSEKTDPIHLTKIYNWLSHCEARELHWEEAMKYSRMALGYLLKSDGNNGLYKSGAYLAIGRNHLEAWKEVQLGRRIETFVPSLDSAFWYYRQSRKFADEEGNQISLASALRLCGEVLSGMGQVEGGNPGGMAARRWGDSTGADHQ